VTSAKLVSCAALVAVVGVGVVALLLPGSNTSTSGDRFVQADDGTRATTGGVRP
jgi:hypothetical protein